MNIDVRSAGGSILLPVILRFPAKELPPFYEEPTSRNRNTRTRFLSFLTKKISPYRKWTTHTKLARKIIFLVLKFLFFAAHFPFCRRSTDAANAVQVMRAHLMHPPPIFTAVCTIVSLPRNSFLLCFFFIDFRRTKLKRIFSLLFAFACVVLCLPVPFMFSFIPSHRQHPPSSPTLLIPSLFSHLHTANISFTTPLLRGCDGVNDSQQQILLSLVG